MMELLWCAVEMGGQRGEKRLTAIHHLSVCSPPPISLMHRLPVLATPVPPAQTLDMCGSPSWQFGLDAIPASLLANVVQKITCTSKTPTELVRGRLVFTFVANLLGDSVRSGCCALLASHHLVKRNTDTIHEIRSVGFLSAMKMSCPRHVSAA